MIAALLQVHHDVQQRHLVPAALGVQCLKVPREDELVVLPAAGHRGEPAARTRAAPASQGALSSGVLGAGGQAPTHRAIGGAPRPGVTQQVARDTENSRSPRPCSPKSASRGKRVQEVSQELGKAEGPSPQPWEAAQEGEVGALWGRAAVEASQGEMEEAAPGQAPHGQAPLTSASDSAPHGRSARSWPACS